MDRDQTPRRWLMTDERLGERLFAALDGLRAGDGVVFRHHRLVPIERRALGERVAAVAAGRGLVLAVSRDEQLAFELGAAWVHNPASHGAGLKVSRSVHDEGQARAVAASDAVLAFVSPVYPTRSHPGAAALGPARATMLAAMSGLPCIALGGMDEARLGTLGPPFIGWAGIDAFSR